MLCVFSASVPATTAYPAGAHMPGMYPGDLLHSVARYVASKVSISGASNREDGQASNSLGLVSDDLGWSEHRLGLHYRDRSSHRDEQEFSAWTLSYGLTVADIDLGIEFRNRDSRGVKEGDAGRIDTESERNVLTVDGRKPVFSWRGISMSGVFSHSTGGSRVADATGWMEQSQYQISKFGVEIEKSHEWPTGLWSSANLRAVSGVDSRQEVDNLGSDYITDQFRKIALSASLSKKVLAWTLGIDGRYQFAPTNLPSAEQLQIAGEALSSGFHGQYRTADEGGWLRLQAGSPGLPIPVLYGAHSYLQISLLRSWAPGVKDEAQSDGGASVGELSLQLDADDFVAAMSVGKMLTASAPSLTRISRPNVSLSLFLTL